MMSVYMPRQLKHGSKALSTHFAFGACRVLFHGVEGEISCGFENNVAQIALGKVKVGDEERLAIENFEFVFYDEPLHVDWI